MLHWETIHELSQQRRQDLMEQAEQNRLVCTAASARPRRTDRVLRSVGKLLVHTGEKLQTISMAYGRAAD